MWRYQSVCHKSLIICFVDLFLVKEARNSFTDLREDLLKSKFRIEGKLRLSFILDHLFNLIKVYVSTVSKQQPLL